MNYSNPVNTERQSSYPVNQSPKLIWVGAAQFKNKKLVSDFPDYWTLKSNFETNKSNGIINFECEEFWLTLSACKNIYILDKFFDIEHLELMFTYLSLKCQTQGYEVKNITIISKKRVELKQAYDEKFQSEDIKVKFIFSWPRHNEIFHDRIALMDSEIWHCGANIGGTHNSLNALSRGWVDKNNKVRIFLENAVKYGEI